MRRKIGWITSIILLGIIFIGGWVFFHKLTVEPEITPKSQIKTTTIKPPNKKLVTSPAEPAIEAKAAVLVDANNGEVVYKKMKPYLIRQRVCQK